jgi:hypothetical protein
MLKKNHAEPFPKKNLGKIRKKGHGNVVNGFFLITKKVSISLINTEDC